MRPKQVKFRSFLCFGLTQDVVINDFAHLADGAAYPAIRPEVVSDYGVVLPTDGILEQFDSVVYPWLRRIGESEIKSETLTKLRDTLLPKLLSGQIRIHDAKNWFRKPYEQMAESEKLDEVIKKNLGVLGYGG